MKHVLILLSLLAIATTSSAQLPDVVYGIGGSWVYEYSEGGFAGGYDTIFDYRALTFLGDGIAVDTDSVGYELYDGAGLIDSAFVFFSIGQTIAAQERYFVHHDIINGGPNGPLAFSVEGDMLVIEDNCFDCFKHYFNRGVISSATTVASPSKVRILSNPVREQIIIENSGKPTLALLRTKEGQVLYKFNLSMGHQTLPFPTQIPGLYLLQWQEEGTDQWRTEKIIRIR